MISGSQVLAMFASDVEVDSRLEAEEDFNPPAMFVPATTTRLELI